MTFLALILALLIGRFVPLPQALEQHEGFHFWRSKVSHWLTHQPLPSSGQRVFQWVGSVLLPVLIVAVVAGFLQSVSWLLSLFFTTAILVVVFGSTQGLERIKLYVKAAETKDWPKAVAKVSEIDASRQPLHSLSEGDWRGLHRAAIGAFSYRALTQAFAPAFWLIIMGPAGALAYRWSCLFASFSPLPKSSSASTQEGTTDRSGVAEPSAHNRHHQGQQNAAWQTLSTFIESIVPLLDWLPVRALGLSLAVTGNFSGSAMRWQQNLLQMGQTSAEFLLLVVDGSLRMAPAYERDINSSLAEVKELHPLLQRTLCLWVTVIALLVLFT